MHGSSTMKMGMEEMAMVFFSGTDTPLFSYSWTPSSTGTYAGTCIFLIFLSIILRALYAFKNILESKWAHNALQRQYIRVLDPAPEAGIRKGPTTATTAILTTNGIDEKVQLVSRKSPLLGNAWSRPWRLSVDLPRALLVTVMVGIGYLLYVFTFHIATSALTDVRTAC